MRAPGELAGPGSGARGASRTPRAWAAALLLLGAARAGATEAWGKFESNVGVTPPVDFNAPGRNAFPVDLGKPLGNPEPRFPFTGLWAYANETGRVRAYASTGSAGANLWLDGNVVLSWEKTFRKQSDLDTLKFTVTPSWLWVNSDLLGRSGEEPYAELSIEVAVTPFRRTQPRSRVELEYHARIGIGPGGLVVQEAEGKREGRPVWIGCGPEVDGQSTAPAPMDCATYHDQGGFDLLGGQIVEDEHQLRFETQVYAGEASLANVAVGEYYTVSYELRAAAAHGIEGHSEAFIGDPLDVDGGLSLEVTSLPADPPRPPRLCLLEPAAGRFDVHLDGTVTDTFTGLMWQRCPAGYTLDDAQTPELGDDRCLPGATPLATWQGALQGAAADATAGHADWRLPNVKELQSIVAPGCLLPAIEQDPFPSTPSDLFWSSTPVADGASSRGVSFGVGLTGALSRDLQAYARRVRDASPPARPLPALRILRARAVVEGDAGTTELVFPVRLDRPADAPVEFDFQAFDLTAVAGVDYVATSGHATIAAGLGGTEVRVPVTDDAAGEPDEALYVAISNPTPNVRVTVPAALGGIVDDEPVLRAWPADAYEGDAGSADLAFPITLSRPALADVTVDWALADGTAAAGSDYVAASGTATVPAGATATLVHVTVTGDTAPEGDEHLSLALSSASANATLGEATARGTIVEDDVPRMAGWNDTGAWGCADASLGGLFCPVAGFPNQDAESGRDVTHPDDADGWRGFSFTKLDAAGAALPADAAAWECVQDEVTGLTWEWKPDDGGLRDRDWSYTWYRSSGIGAGGAPGTQNGGTCVDAASCDTEAYAAAVNAAGLCGQGDWRLPTREELLSLADVATTQGEPHRDFFDDGAPTTAGSYYYWTADTSAADTASAHALFNLSAGSVSTHLKSTPLRVRLVRGGN